VISVQIVPGSNNAVAIELISTQVRRKLKERYVHIRPRIARGLTEFQPGIQKPPALDVKWLNITLLERAPQLHVCQTAESLYGSMSVDCLLLVKQGIYTILRDKTTSREDFIFYIDRLAAYLAEKAMEFLSFKSKSVETPVGVVTEGKELDSVRILSSGMNIDSLVKCRVVYVASPSYDRTLAFPLLHLILTIIFQRRNS